MSAQRTQQYRGWIPGPCVALLAILAFAGAASAEHAEVYVGDVAIDTDVSGRVIVALDEAARTAPPDGVVDRLFILQRKGGSSTELSRAVGLARVVFTGDELKIDPVDGGLALTLSVGRGESLSDLADVEAEERQRARAAGEASASVERRRLEGFGLAHVWGGLEGSPLDAIAAEREVAAREAAAASNRRVVGHNLVCGPDGGGSGNNVDCQAGGCGSSSCSVSGCNEFPHSCSVECESGNFSCCDCPATGGAKCKCNSNDLCASNCD